MADISVLSRLVNGASRNVDLTNNTPVVLSIKVGGGVSNTELTKAILDKLILVQNAADSDGTFDTRYTKKTDLASIASGKGASLVGVQDNGSYYVGTNVETVLAEIGSKLGSGAASGITYSNSTSGLTATNVQSAIDEVDGRLDTVEANYIPSSQKGVANGVASLDAGGKVPVSQLPNSIMEYQGTYNASTNTPTLVNGTGNTGDVYRVTVAGAGVNSLNFIVGDYVIYNGSTWEKAHSGADSVISVNGFAGAVVLTTDNVSEGTVNLYYTDERAQDAVAAALTNTATVNFTYNDAANQISADVNNNSISAAKLTTGVADQSTITGGNGTALAVQNAPLMKRTLIAGESMAANTSFLVRWAVNGETAGRVYKADKDASTASKYMAIGIALSGAGASAGDPVSVILMGEHTLGSSDTAFGATDIGKEVFLGSSGAFILGSALTNAANEAQYCVGIVETTSKIWIDAKQLRGIT